MPGNLLTLDMGRPMSPMVLDDAGIASGMAFLTGELEKRNPELNEPLVAVTWQRDMVAETGGGWVDFTSNFFVNYATSGANQHGIIGGATNVIPIIQANVSKDVYRTFDFGNIIKVPFFDQQRANQIGRSLDELFNNGLQLNWNKTLDQNVYFGFPEYGSTGLVNDPNVTTALAALNGAATSRAWADKSPEEILADVDDGIEAVWAASEYDVDGIPNQILLPPAKYADINRRLISTAGSQSVLNYLLDNNIAKTQGVNFNIVPCRQCIGAGLSAPSGGIAVDRMVLYRNEMKRVSFDIPVPLMRALTQPSVNDMAYLTAYVAKIGQVKFKYFQTIRYVDGI